MTWFGWLLLGVYIAGGLLTITQIGVAKKPTTPGQAAFQVALNAACIVAVLMVGTGHL